MREALPLERWPSDIRRYLERHGVVTWDLLSGMTESKLLVWQGFGAKRMERLRELIQAEGRKLPHIRVPGDVPPRTSRADHPLFTPKPTQGIYFVACDGFIKIGVADCVLRRVDCIRGMIPLELIGLGFIHEPDNRYMTRNERALHRRFAAHRHRGEWFRDHPEIRAYIQEHAQPWPQS